MEKIMILGAGRYQVPIIEKARELGYETIAISPQGDYPGLAIADKVYYLDVRDEQGILNVARAERITGVTTDQTDIAVRTVAYIAEQMNLPGIGYETAKLFTDKYMMRERSMDLGLPTIRHKLAHTLEEAEAFFRELGRSAIIKPVDNQGSRGVFMIDSIKELNARFYKTRAFSPTELVIIEEYIHGREFEVDSIVVNYEEKTLMYADTDLYGVPNVFASKTRLYPSVVDDESVGKLLDLNHKTITGFGLRQGLTHSEYIQDETTGEIYLIEAAARGGGSFISSHIAELQSGLNTSEFLVKLATGRIDKMPNFGSNLCHCGYVTFYLPEGEVVDEGDIDKVRAFEFVKKDTLDDIYLGLKTGSFSDKTARNVIILEGTSREELLQRVEIIRNTLNIRVRTRLGIEGPIWE